MTQPFGAQLVAGDTWTWSVPFVGDYDPAIWTLKFFFRGAGGQINAIAAVVGDQYQITVAGTDTVKLTAGDMAWQAVLVGAAGRVEVGRGTVEILPNIEAQTSQFDGRSWVKRTLDAIRNVLEGVAGREDQEYQVTTSGGGGRSLKTMSRTELVKLEGIFAARYRRELIEKGQLSPNSNQVRVRFS